MGGVFGKWFEAGRKRFWAVIRQFAKCIFKILPEKIWIRRGQCTPDYRSLVSGGTRTPSGSEPELAPAPNSISDRLAFIRSPSWT